MKKIGRFICSAYVFYGTYSFLFFYLFSIIFLDLNSFFSQQVQIFLFVSVPVIWSILMHSKMAEFELLDRVICWFNMHSEKINNNLYAFPKKITYTNGSTDFEDGKITINGINFSKFTYTKKLKFIKNHPGVHEYSTIYDKFDSPIVSCGFQVKQDFFIGLAGFVILFNFGPAFTDGFYLFFAPIVSWIFGMLIAGLMYTIPTIPYGLKERLAVKLIALNTDKIDKNTKNVLACWLRDPDNMYIT